MDRESKKEEILAAMRNVAGGIQSDPADPETATQMVKVDIGGITIKNSSPSTNSERAEGICHCEPRTRSGKDLLVFNIVALFLLILAVVTFCLNRMYPTEVEILLSVIAAASLVGSLGIFSAVSLYRKT